MELFCCPLCGGTLQLNQNSLHCPKKHSFDVAKEGYAHLLPAQKMHSKIPGDNKEMVLSRRTFLQGGFYAPFAQALSQLVCQEAKCNTLKILDAGCGEGYYTKSVTNALRTQNISAQIAAFDISKHAVRAAARLDPEIEWAVASSFAIPTPKRTFDCVINVFSPMVAKEFLRVLKPGGALLYAVPGARHLFGLKEILYETPYENKVQDIAYEGFRLEQRIPVQLQSTITGAQIQNLFTMTPYYWKTPKEGAAKLQQCEHLETELSFDFLVYRRM